MVSDGQRLSQTEQREARQPQPRSVPQLIRSLNKARQNSTLYVKLLASDAGAVVRGELLSSLPPSVLAVLESDRSGGSFNPLSSATIGEWELPTDHVDQWRADADDSGFRELTRFSRPLSFRESFNTWLQSRPLDDACWSSRRFSSAPRRSRAPRRQSSFRPPRRPTSSRAKSRTCRSTRADSWSSGRPPNSSTKRRRHFSGRSCRRRTDRSSSAPATTAGSSKSTPRARASPFFDARNSRCMRIARGPNGGLYVGHLPRRQDLQGRSERHREHVLRPGGKVHLGACRRQQGQRLRRHRRKRRRLQDHARRKRLAVLPDEGDARDGAGARQVWQPARRHRIARTGSSRRRRRQGVRPARLAFSGNSHAAVRRQGHPVRRRRQRPGDQRRGAVGSDRHRRRRRPGRRSIARAGPVGLGFHRNYRHRRRRRRRGTSGSGTSRAGRPADAKGAIYRIAPTVCGIRSGNRGKTLPYDVAFDGDGA